MTTYIESSVYTHSELRGCHNYVLPALLKLSAVIPAGSRLLDVGCGNGSIAGIFAKLGYQVVGIDMAEKGIAIARQACPAGRFEVLPADRNILRNLGEDPFDLVYSSEVIEHLYDPKSFLEGCFTATREGGRFIVTTPYHGYLKNLALSVMDKWDHHHNPLFDGGHIKFFSRRTLMQAMLEAGFTQLEFAGAGRMPYLWASMLISGRKA